MRALSLLLVAACSGTCGADLPQRSSSGLGTPAPALQHRPPELSHALPAPTCEASALLMLSDHTWLVADNEIHDRLFSFTRAFDEAEAFGMPSEHRPRDIEALARVGEREFLVVGSHSHRRDGSVSPKRHRLRWLRFVSHERGTEETNFAETTPESWREDECGSLLRVESPNEAALALRFCAALLASDEMDIEGAATLEGNVWLGFRTPLVDGEAVMARLDGHRLRFDALRSVDLGGRGIRGMDDFEGDLYLIGGPSDDRVEEHVLFRAGDWTATRLASLPPFSEGLAIHSPGHALVVTDGRQASIGCEEASTVRSVTFNPAH